MINEIYIFYSVVNDFDKLYSRKIICQKNVLVEKIFLQIWFQHSNKSTVMNNNKIILWQQYW